ncbi:asparagine synthase-related protein [Epilithonimonas arachidiradicis]|uniref:asparagine synthase (glutamine-hydrolyzing) n=1 Tax=Epilithonimonas arachidiradicis TaxID=1617282 RepID=A0A420DC57_9FLAO|nr:asparagine synthase-related protein [Epilithonimonas arachidiradicis]RKE89510.1 asparagine synthase (glutamine-hydrolysing) [Epilithonimonas arachidiradicis]GGG42986.1 hypothetical protein GCM10007332_00660 [Epilithonimonas arachidiradicis]
MNQGFQLFISEKKVKTDVFFVQDYDSIVIDNENFQMVIEGVILNKKQLLGTSYYSDFSTFFSNLYRDKDILAIQDLDGEFRGYVWNKLDEKVFVFTNPTSTQRVFYTKQQNQILIDTHLVRLSQSAKRKNFSISPNIDNIYSLLTFGNMLENQSPINQVFKILDGYYLEIELKNQSVVEKKYFDLEKTEYFKENKKNAIQELNSIFSENVLWEYQKDNELNSKHFTLLSGGLDSRMALLYAEKLNEKPDEAFCFSQSGYLDETISRQIAKDYKIPYTFQPLDRGDYLAYIDKLTELSEGCGLFTGGIHVQYAFENLKNKDFKIVHSGSIGDGILGGFNTVPYRQKPGEFKIVVNRTFLPKVQSDFNKIRQQYESEELFYLRNVAYNRTVLGAQVIQQYAYQTSPFMSKKMLAFAISLPEKWKIHQKLYLQWLNQCMPNAADYIWEKTGMKPDAQWKSMIGPQVKKRLSKIWNTKILKRTDKTSMYPYEFYYNNSKDIQNYYQNYFQENIWRLENYMELKNDVEILFSDNNFYHKSQAINILAIFKLFFN